MFCLQVSVRAQRDFLTPQYNSQGVCHAVVIVGANGEARPQLRHRLPVRIQFPVGGLSRGPQLIRQLARTTHTASHLRGASLWSGDKTAAYFLTESKGNQRAAEAARVHPLLLILEVTLAPAQSQDSKWTLLGGGCQELLQTLVQGCKKRSELDSPRKAEVAEVSRLQSRPPPGLPLPAGSRKESPQVLQLLVAISSPWHALARRPSCYLSLSDRSPVHLTMTHFNLVWFCLYLVSSPNTLFAEMGSFSQVLGTKIQ